MSGYYTHMYAWCCVIMPYYYLSIWHLFGCEIVFYVNCGIPAFHAFQMREFPEFPHFTHYAFPDPRTWTGCWGWHRTSLAWRGVTGHHGKGSGLVMSACPRCDVCIIICTRTYIYICILGNTRITNAGIPGIPALQMREFREYPHSVSHLWEINN